MPRLRKVGFWYCGFPAAAAGAVGALLAVMPALEEADFYENSQLFTKRGAAALVAGLGL